ncbi:Exopolysaccharide synthesis ExoD [Thalassoporum mexicanum PCC 7367]|uniref:exopolysaccharide biosynthesis protein n=1 Tax=Thalassoporum mexicanum TaxID=3457544 RepID=UPI00029FBF6E|nr:exopolysaccharide biosynthesis protein [Pseudanabaena sp. PCC 7367]AFY71707.1 Exopolysaccharide synthesis ExoD [Pseudanabaena sp. PCC 7367]
MARLSVELQRFLFEEKRPERITLESLLELTEEKIFGFLFVILAIPSALPIPAPVISSVLSMPLFLLVMQFIWGAKKPWLPRRLSQGTISLNQAQKFAKAAIPWLQRFETFLRPRLIYVCTSIGGRLLVGMAITLMSMSMMVILPFTNTLPAIGIAIIGLGLTEDDGAVSLFGVVFCLFAGFTSATVIYAWFWGGSHAIDWLKNALGR